MPNRTCYTHIYDQEIVKLTIETMRYYYVRMQSCTHEEDKRLLVV